MAINIVSLEDLAAKLNLKKDEQQISRAFKMDFSFTPRKEKDLVKLKDEVICSVGNFSLIIAPPGSGKSNVSEAIASGALNPECDSLGFTVDSKKTLLIDTERVLNDLWRGLNRIKKRTGLEPEKITGALDVFSFIELSTDESKKELEHLIMIGEYDLVIVDGAADFVKSVNDEEESKSFWKWIIGLANKKEFGLIFTIHPNPGDEEGKATGHIGSQGQKKAESVFLVRRSKDDKQVREITTDFAQGKVRNAADKITSAFKWSDDKSMFVSCDKPVYSGIREVKDMFRFKDAYSYGELCRSYKDKAGVSLSTAKRHIKEALELDDIYQSDMGLYFLNRTAAEEEITNADDQENQNQDQQQEEDIVPF